MYINEENKTLVLKHGNYLIEFDPKPIAEFIMKIPNVQNLRHTFFDCIVNMGMQHMQNKHMDTSNPLDMEVLTALHQCVDRAMDKFKIEEIPGEASHLACSEIFRGISVSSEVNGA